MIEKTFTTFHASNVLLQQQYKERRFTKYSKLISCLIIAKQSNELLMKIINPSNLIRIIPEVNVLSS